MVEAHPPKWLKLLAAIYCHVPLAALYLTLQFVAQLYLQTVLVALVLLRVPSALRETSFPYRVLQVPHLVAVVVVWVSVEKTDAVVLQTRR